MKILCSDNVITVSVNRDIIVADKHADVDRGCVGDVVISGQRPQVVNESQVVEMLDGLSLDNEDNDEDRLSDDSVSDASEGITRDLQLPYHSNTPSVQSCTSDSARTDEKVLVAQHVPSSDSDLFSKAVKCGSSDQFRRGLFKSCVDDVSSTVAIAAKITAQSQQSAGQEVLSGCDNENVRTVCHTCDSRKLHETVAAEQTTLERVKTCLYEWKTAELVAFLRADPREPIHSPDSLHEKTREDTTVSNVEEVNKDGIENNTDNREETVKLYERKVEEFYGQKPRVTFADMSKQVMNFYTSFFLSKNQFNS